MGRGELPEGRIHRSGPARLIEVVDAPKIDGVETQGAHRVIQTTVGGKPRTGELYNYVARFGPFMVIVTANPLVMPDKPVVPSTPSARAICSARVCPR